MLIKGPTQNENSKPIVMNNCMKEPKAPLTASSDISPMYMGSTVNTPPTANPQRVLAMRNEVTEVAVAHNTNAAMKGAVDISSVFFRPILSAATPATNGPNVAPNGNNEPIQESSSGVMGNGKGFKVVSFEYNLGITGEVQPKAVPQVKAARLPENKRSIVNETNKNKEMLGRDLRDSKKALRFLNR